MGEFINRVMGRTKTIVGRNTGNRSLQAKGTVQSTKGKAQTGVRRAKNSIERGSRKLATKSATRKTTAKASVRKTAKRPTRMGNKRASTKVGAYARY